MIHARTGRQFRPRRKHVEETTTRWVLVLVGVALVLVVMLAIDIWL